MYILTATKFSVTSNHDDQVQEAKPDSSRMKENNINGSFKECIL